MEVNLALEVSVRGTFELGYSKLGPTEAIIGMIVFNTLLSADVGLDARATLRLTYADVLLLGVVGLMVALLARRTVRNIKTFGVA